MLAGCHVVPWPPFAWPGLNEGKPGLRTRALHIRPGLPRSQPRRPFDMCWNADIDFVPLSKYSPSVRQCLGGTIYSNTMQVSRSG
jgi:hypothetical protein